MKRSSDFIQLVPDGWLRKYLDTMVEVRNEMPLPFHFLCASVVMGQMLGLRVWAAMNVGVKAFPNINALLVSPAGRCRRGEGSKLAIKVARYANVNVFEGKVTGEGLADELNDVGGDLLLYVEELSTMFGKREHQKAVIPFITKALLRGEGPLEERTRMGGRRVTVNKCNLSMIGTTAPEWFPTAMPEEAYGGGLMSRYFTCYLADREVDCIDLTAQGDYEHKWVELASELQQLVKDMPSGQVMVTEEANKWVKGWYSKKEVVMDARMAPHVERRPANMTRLAMLLACSGGEGVLNKTRLEQALEIVKWIEPTIFNMYSATDEMQSYMSKGEVRILAELGRVEGGMGMGHVELCRGVSKHFDRGMREVRTALEGLEEKQLIERVGHAFMSPGVWPPKGWRLRG